VKYEEVVLKGISEWEKMPESGSVTISDSTYDAPTKHLLSDAGGRIYFYPFEESEKGVIDR